MQKAASRNRTQTNCSINYGAPYWQWSTKSVKTLLAGFGVCCKKSWYSQLAQRKYT